jgi:hypothetical protein
MAAMMRRATQFYAHLRCINLKVASLRPAVAGPKRPAVQQTGRRALFQLLSCSTVHVLRHSLVRVTAVLRPGTTTPGSTVHPHTLDITKS